MADYIVSIFNKMGRTARKNVLAMFLFYSSCTDVTESLTAPVQVLTHYSHERWKKKKEESQSML